jgi:hypothetical protein
MTYPTSTIAKMFFTQDHDGNGTTNNFVCTAEVINVDRVSTAGHCVNNGLNGAGANGGWSTNVSFCPSYNAGGVNAQRGCWGSIQLATTGEWFVNGNLDRDLGGSHSVQGNAVWPGSDIGAVTGWLGRAWNWSWEHNVSFGYPVGAAWPGGTAPFPGYHIITCSGTAWYTNNWGTGADSKYIGCDMTGGSSGGPWILGLGHPNSSFHYATLPGSPDPGDGQWLNGVNSHRRITTSLCGTTTSGYCVHEMASMPFTNEANGSEAFFAFLFGL